LTKKVAGLPYNSITQFSDRDISYANDDSPLHALLPYRPNLEGLKQSLRDRKKYPVDRPLLVQVLKDQFKDFEEFEPVKANVESLLREDCYTITTAHQPVVLTGPLYVIYKALSVIQWARKLQEDLEEGYVVPVFIVGGEDHDFEEIRSVNVFRKSIKWDFQHRGGSVGSIPSGELVSLVQELESFFENDPKGMKLLAMIKQYYENGDRFTRATQMILHKLMGHLGLICIDMSDERLKRVFIPQIKKEVLHSKSKNLVLDMQHSLEELGFNHQAYARDINFFYLREHSRELIFKDGKKFKLESDEMEWTEKEMELEIESHPERFSPNVIMRPVYESIILPDIAYLGGGGELAYWMERPRQFEALNIHFPVLLRRKSMALIDQILLDQWEELGFRPEQLVSHSDELKKEFVYQDSEVQLERELREILSIFQLIEHKAVGIDPSLSGKVKGMQKSVENMIEGLEKRLVRSLKKKYEEKISKIDKIKRRVHPDHSLQERSENILSFYTRTEKPFVDYLMEHIDATDGHFDFLAV
jgi:bacillithiol biosynthesis cysteine-adding enzyme BshC